MIHVEMDYGWGQLHELMFSLVKIQIVKYGIFLEECSEVHTNVFPCCLS
jgi:hypothetical protein